MYTFRPQSRDTLAVRVSSGCVCVPSLCAWRREHLCVPLITLMGDPPGDLSRDYQTDFTPSSLNSSLPTARVSAGLGDSSQFTFLLRGVSTESILAGSALRCRGALYTRHGESPRGTSEMRCIHLFRFVAHNYTARTPSRRTPLCLRVPGRVQQRDVGL